MQEFKTKLSFKDYIGKIVNDFGISRDMYETAFSPVFEDLFDKDSKCVCLRKYYHSNILEIIIDELANIKKTNKKNFLTFFEDCQTLNNELNEVVQKIKINCSCTEKICIEEEHTKIDISKYPLFSALVEDKNLKVYKPELIASPQFIEFFGKNVGRHGLYFLYNTDRELLLIGKSENIGKELLNIIYERNIEGYVAVAYTKTISDIYVYENYYIIKEQPLLNTKNMAIDGLSINLKELTKSELVKIYENN
jgi:hypothetical protein